MQRTHGWMGMAAVVAVAVLAAALTVDLSEQRLYVMRGDGERRDPGWFQRVINRVRQSREVRLSRPVTLQVRE